MHFQHEKLKMQQRVFKIPTVLTRALVGHLNAASPSIVSIPPQASSHDTELTGDSSVVCACVSECNNIINMTIRNALRDHGQRYRPRMACLKKVSCESHLCPQAFTCRPSNTYNIVIQYSPVTAQIIGL